MGAPEVSDSNVSAVHICQLPLVIGRTLLGNAWQISYRFIPIVHTPRRRPSHTLSLVETMNDAGLDPAIQDAAKEADGDGNENSRTQIDDSTYLHWASKDRDLAQFLQPARWWFASTEIPLTAVSGICDLSPSGRGLLNDAPGYLRTYGQCFQCALAVPALENDCATRNDARPSAGNK